MDMMKMISEDKVWVFDNGSNIPSGPYASEKDAYEDIKIITARNSSGERNECSEPYQMERSRLRELVLKYLDEDIDESMSQSEKKEFYARLLTEKVHFQYHKIKGEIRKAYGTLIASELPEPRHSSDTKAEARDKYRSTFPEDSVFYYDLDKNGFRSFKMKLFDKYLDK